MYTNALEDHSQSEPRDSLGLDQWVDNLVGANKDATVAIQQIGSAEKWSPEDV